MAADMTMRVEKAHAAEFGDEMRSLGKGDRVQRDRRCDRLPRTGGCAVPVAPSQAPRGIDAGDAAPNDRDIEIA